MASRLDPILKTMVPGLTLRLAILNGYEMEIEDAMERLQQYAEPMTSWHLMYKSPTW